jgi:hypothetical protein
MLRVAVLTFSYVCVHTMNQMGSLLLEIWLRIPQKIEKCPSCHGSLILDQRA